MRVHWLQHADHEDAGTILPWLAVNGHEVRGSRLHAGDPPPAPETFDALIVMGGPMNIYEHAAHPWLVAEKQLIRRALDGGKRLLGICLGAQLIADQLGGPVTRNAESEIGWWPLRISAAGRQCGLFGDWPDDFEAFHWHGDTFALPPGTESLAASTACVNQAFTYHEGRVLGLQFHPEVTAAMLRDWFRLDPPQAGRHVQEAYTVLARADAFAQSRALLEALLPRFFQ